MDINHFGQMLTWQDVAIRLVLALALSSFIGVEREKRNRPAGMRTHVLVCIGATLVAMVEQQTIADVAALASPQIGVSVGRITAGVLFGIGFLGAGTIIMTDRKVTGLTTAASVWCTACLGLAIGAGYIFMPVICCVVMTLVLKIMQKVVVVPTYKKLLVQFTNRQSTMDCISDFFEKNNVKVLDVDFHTEQESEGKGREGKVYTNVYTIIIPGKADYVQMVEALSEMPDILAVKTQNRSFTFIITHGILTILEKHN